MIRPAVRRSGLTIVEVVVILVIILVLIALLLPAVQQAREAARRTQWRNNLKQLGLAFHNYHDNYNMFPPGGVIGADGTAYHGWTTPLMAYIDCNPFFNSIDFKIPWDHPQQLEKFMLTIPVLMDPSIPDRPDYGLDPANKRQLGPVHFSVNSWLMYRNSSIGIDKITSGMNHTLMAADAYDHYAPFGYPYNWRDLELGLNTSPEGFGNRVREGIHILLADGSVTYSSSRVPDSLVATWAGAPSMRSPAERTARPPGPYQLTSPHYWRTVNLWIDRGEKTAVTLRIEPDGEAADVIYGQMEDVCGWPPTGDFVTQAAVECPQLRCLRFRGEMDPTVMQQLAALPHLRELDLTASPDGLKKGMVRTLSQWGTLESLTFRDGWIDAEDVADLQRCPKLRSLLFAWSFHLPTWQPAAIPGLRKALPDVELVCEWSGQPISDYELATLTERGKTLADLPEIRQTVDALTVLPKGP